MGKVDMAPDCMIAPRKGAAVAFMGLVALTGTVAFMFIMVVELVELELPMNAGFNMCKACKGSALSFTIHAELTILIAPADSP